MSAEPPVGDELQQMLAGMRENVRGRLIARPRRHSVRRRVGITTAVVALLGIGTASGAVALGMLPQPFVAPAPVVSTHPALPEQTPTTPSAPITLTPAPQSSAAPTAAASTIPTSCTDVVPAREYTRLFGSLVRQQLRPTPPGAPEQQYFQDPETPFTADAALVCRWSGSGSTEETDNLFLQLGQTDAATLDARLEELRTRGWNCTEVHGGRSCQHTETSTYYGEHLDTTFTFFVRGDEWVSITQTNIPTDGLLDAVVQQLRS
jgi:hypothetical protein